MEERKEEKRRSCRMEEWRDGAGRHVSAPHVCPSVSAVLVSREDEFSSRLSSRAGFRGCSALHYATLADDPHIVRMLLEAGTSPPLTRPRPHPLSHVHPTRVDDDEAHVHPRRTSERPETDSVKAQHVIKR